MFNQGFKDVSPKGQKKMPLRNQTLLNSDTFSTEIFNSPIGSQDLTSDAVKVTNTQYNPKQRKLGKSIQVKLDKNKFSTDREKALNNKESDGITYAEPLWGDIQTTINQKSAQLNLLPKSRKLFSTLLNKQSTNDTELKLSFNRYVQQPNNNKQENTLINTDSTSSVIRGKQIVPA